MQVIRLLESKPAVVVEGQSFRVDVKEGITAEARTARLIELQELAPTRQLLISHHSGLSSLPDISFLRNLRTLEVPDPRVRKLPESFPSSLREWNIAHLADASWMQSHAFHEARLSGRLRTLNIQTSFLWLRCGTRLASLFGKVRL